MVAEVYSRYREAAQTEQKAKFDELIRQKDEE